MRTSKGRELPLLLPHQFALVHVDVWTGKVLGLDGVKQCNVIDEDWVLIFDNLEEAENYALQRITGLPDLQCSIYDHRKRWLKDIVLEGRRRQLPEEPPRRWWKFWRRQS